MDSIVEKYNNFKIFLEDVPNVSSVYIGILKTVDINMFFKTLDAHKDKTPNEIALLICQRAEIDINNVPEAMKNKFNRYIEYFIEIKNTLNM